MARYIDADKLKKEGWMLVRTYSINPQRICHESKSIDEIPPADVRENVRGEWLPDNTFYYETRFVCSNCKESECVPTIGFTKYKPLWDFCPNCGADMRGKQDEIH